MPENLATNSWSIANIPPEKSPDLGKFVYELFLDSRSDKEDRHMPERWRDDFKLNRGKHWRSNKPEHQKFQIMLPLMSYYREKNVISLCSRHPVAEVKLVNGKPVPVEIEDDTDTNDPPTTDMLMNVKIQGWWEEMGLQTTLRRAVHLNETYGTMWERFVPMLQNVGEIDGKKIFRCLPPVFEPGDPFGHFPPPANFGQPSDGPFHAVASIWDIAAAKAFYRLPDGSEPNIQAEEELAKEVLGLGRREDAPEVRSNTIADGGGFDNDWGPTGNGTERPGGKYRPEKCLVIECWIKDRRTGLHKEMFEEPDPNNPEEMILVEREVTGPLYPGNIRMVTITNRGDLVLRDLPNPNINPALPRSVTRNTWGWDHFPFHKMVSYHDEQSPYGFSQAEQIGPMNLRIDELLAKLVQGVMMQAAPILVMPKGAGIDPKKIRTSPGDVIQTAFPTKDVYYLVHPGIGPDGKWLLSLLLSLSDQMASHQEVDRGEAPGGVISASAIEGMREQNQTMRENKISEVDALIEWRGRWMISYLQNFHWEKETLYVRDMPVSFVGMDHAGYKYLYTAQKGSTYIQSNSTKFKDAIELFKLGAIDTLELLKAANYPNAEAIVARMYGDPMSAAIQTMLDAGAITEQDAALIRGKLEAIKAGQVPDHSGMEAPLPGLQADAAGGAQPQLTPQPALPSAPPQGAQ